MTTTKIWECKIGEVDSVAGGADYPMRQAVAVAYREITGAEPVFIFSGWGALLTEAERAVVEAKTRMARTPAGLYAWLAEYPEEGMLFIDPDAPAPAPATTPEQKRPINCGTGHCSCIECVMPDGPLYQPATAPEQCGHCGRRVIDAPWPVRDTTPDQPSWQDAPTEPGMWACLYMGELSTAIFNAYEIEHFDRNEMVGCRWFGPIPEDKP